MSGLLALDWLWLTIGSGLAVIGAALLLRALFGDRPRGRRRCPKCWYDMGGGHPAAESDGAVWICPECGRQARAAMLIRTRRRWLWALAAFLLLAGGYPLAIAPRIHAHGWAAALPTMALIYWVGWFEPPEVYDSATRKMSSPTDAAAELARRVGAGSLSGWQWRVLIDRLQIVGWRKEWPRSVPWEVSLSVPSWLRTVARIEAELPTELWLARPYNAAESDQVRSIPSIGFP